ncbi:MAG: uracil phosphoribosyltransferase [Thermoflexibacter sp.]
MFVLVEQNSIANQFLAELRHQEIQKDKARFRHNLERVGEVLAYEISKKLDYQAENITTPLGIAHTHLPKSYPILACIMRAGFPFYQGFLRFFDSSESAFIGAFRGKTKEGEHFDVELHYSAVPNLHDKSLIIIDPMLATGKSIVLAYKQLLNYGVPLSVHIASVIASREGIHHLSSQIPHAKIWVGEVDEELNKKFYIVPGLGDAGDLAFGEKL